MVSSVRSKFTFKGMMAPTFAPFNEDGSLNLNLVPLYAQFLHENGVTGVFVSGTMGEGVSMTLAERKTLAEAWVKCRDMVGDIVIQVGGTNIADVKEMASHAETLDVSAIAVLPPLYDKPPAVEDLIHYCREVANAASNTPLLYYHIPFKTGVTFPMDEFLTKAAPLIPSLSGMKFTSMDVSGEGLRCHTAADGQMTVLTGFDQTLSAGRRLGFPGAVNAIFNLMPLEAGKLFCLAGLTENSKKNCCVTEENREEEISKIQRRIDLIWDIFKRHDKGHTVGAAKAVMTLMTGIDVGPPRTPIRPLGVEALTDLTKDLTDAGFKIRTQ